MVTAREISDIWLGEPRNAIETRLEALCAMMPTLMRYLCLVITSLTVTRLDDV